MGYNLIDTTDDIENLAYKVLKDNNYENKLLNVSDLAKKNGFYVGTADLEDEIDGMILVDPTAEKIAGVNTKRLIVVNNKRDYKVMRFIIAHELGHYFMSPNKDTSIIAHREHRRGKSNEENKVDFFAACLLMPKDLFTKAYETFSLKIEDNESLIKRLSDFFSVTESCITRRISELSLGEN